MNKAARIVLLAILITAAIPVVALSADLPKEGKYNTTFCYSGVTNRVEFSKTDWAVTYEHSGAVLSNPSGGMFDKSSTRCIGMLTAFGGKSTNVTVCLVKDPDGDVRMLYSAPGPDGKRIRQVIGGTGKYEGMVETNTQMDLGPFPTIKDGTYQGCTNNTGTYKLK